MSIGVGIVGFGSAGRQHADALTDHSHAHVASVLEHDPAVDVGAQSRASSWSDLLDDSDVRIVALCTPPGARAALAVQALSSGRSVLLEKPPAMSVAELTTIEEAARRSGGAVGVMLQHRWRLPQNVDVDPWRRPEVTGVLEVFRYRPGSHYERSGWRTTADEALGGITAHLGVHYLDLACTVLGDVVDVDLAPARAAGPGIDSRVSGWLVFASGATLAFTISAESTVRRERLSLVAADRALTVIDGDVELDVNGTVTREERLDVRSLRRAVYGDVATAVAAGRQPERSHLCGARAVTYVLEQVRDHQAGPS